MSVNPESVPQSVSLSKPRSLADVRAVIKRPTTSVELILDGELTARLEHLERDLKRAKISDELDNEPDQAPRIQREIAELHQQADSVRQAFTFQALSHRAYQRLVTEHPATDEQITAAREAAQATGKDYVPPDVNGTTFTLALVTAMGCDPKGTLEEWEGLWDDLSNGQADQLFGAAFDLQRFGTGDLVPKSDTE